LFRIQTPATRILRWAKQTSALILDRVINSVHSTAATAQ